eukprot:gene8988-10543_t
MLQLMAAPDDTWDHRHSEGFCLFIAMCRPALQRDCGQQRMLSLRQSLAALARDANLPTVIRKKALNAAKDMQGDQTEEIETHLDTSLRHKTTNEQIKAIVELINVTPEKIHLRFIDDLAASAKQSASDSSDIANMFYCFTSVFGKDIKEELSLALVQKIIADLKTNPLAKYIVTHLVTPHVAAFKSLTMSLNITNPLPALFKPDGYALPTKIDLPFTMQWDHVELFKLTFDQQVTTTSPTLLDIACYQGRKELASYLLTNTTLLEKSNPLWWLALTNNFQLAQQLIFNNSELLDKMDRKLLAAGPANSPTILDLLRNHNHKNQRFIDSCVAAGLVSNSEQAELEKNKANDYYGKSKFKEAIECYTNAIQIDRPTHILYSNRSIAHFKLGQFQQSLVDAEESLKLQPDWIKSHLRKGAALESLGRLEESMVAYQTGLKFDTKQPELLKSLEQLQLKITKQDEPIVTSTAI